MAEMKRIKEIACKSFTSFYITIQTRTTLELMPTKRNESDHLATLIISLTLLLSHTESSPLTYTN
jgi:hypothetical protein